MKTHKETKQSIEVRLQLGQRMIAVYRHGKQNSRAGTVSIRCHTGGRGWQNAG